MDEEDEMNIFKKVRATRRKKQEREEELKRAHEVALMACSGKWFLNHHDRACILMELDQIGIGLPGVDL